MGAQSLAEKVSAKEISLFGINVCNCSPDEGLELLDSAINSGRSSRAMIVNAACVNISFRNNDYREAMGRYDVRFVDGVGIYLAGRILRGVRLPDLNGTDFGKLFMRHCADKGYRVFFLGARRGVAEKAAANFKALYPSLKIAGYHHGYFRSDQNDEVIETINETGPDVLVVCFGKPREVFWIDENIDRLAVRLAIPLGGFLDFYSGQKPRAPGWILKIRSEWLYRLILEPRRMWKRYLIGNLIFIIRVLRWKLAGG
jgi:N-acetylglucosaminyldiphosphoundecaprenol N-acetyl-beta-D-mannosaminyltransferase